MSPLPSIVTPALLSFIRGQPNLPYHTWYFITVTTLSCLNRPDEIPFVYKHAMDYGAGAVDSKPEFEEQLKISRRIREALVKAGAVIGMPKVQSNIHNFKIFILMTCSLSTQCWPLKQ